MADAPNLFDFLGEFIKTAEPVPAEVHTFEFRGEPQTLLPDILPDINVTMTPMSLGDAALARCIGTGESAMVTVAGEPYAVASATPNTDGDMVYLLTPVGESDGYPEPDPIDAAADSAYMSAMGWDEPGSDE